MPYTLTTECKFQGSALTAVYMKSIYPCQSIGNQVRRNANTATTLWGASNYFGSTQFSDTNMQNKKKKRRKKKNEKKKRKSMHGDSQLFENLTSTIEVRQVSLGSVIHCSKGRQHWNVQLSRMKQPFGL